MKSKKILIKGINQDDSYPFLDTGEYLHALNMRFATTENGKVGQHSNIEGNVIKNNAGAFTLPAGQNTTIGAFEDTPNRRVFFFNKNSNGSHGVYCYDADDDTVYTVILSSQVVGGLGFDSLIHSVDMFENLLYWTDGVNPQRRINVEAGIKLNQPSYTTTVAPYILNRNSSGGTGTTHMASSVINLIRNQPWAPATATPSPDGTYGNNFMKEEAFQFAYRFVYRDKEVSTLSPLSKTVNYQSANRVIVAIPYSQKIEQDVIRVELIVKYLTGGSYFVVHTFRSGFAEHNAGTTQLTYNFYNDAAFAAVDDASAVKPFDAIPRTSQTLAIAKNRLFLANNKDGYDAPTSTSLSLGSSTTTLDTVLVGSWFRVNFIAVGISRVRYMLYLRNAAGGFQDGYYDPTTPVNTPLPTTYNHTTNNLDYAGATNIQVQNYLDAEYAGPVTVNSITPMNVNATITGILSNGPEGQAIFKSSSSYRAGVVFFDEAGRNCGVVTRDLARRVTGDRAYSDTGAVYTSSIDWSLSQNIAEIPTWATHYSIVRTKNLRYASFIQLRTGAGGVKYIAKDNTGAYTTPATAPQSNVFGLAIDISQMFKYKMGYTFVPGSQLRLWPSDNTGVRTLTIRDTFSNFIITDFVDLGTTTSLNALYEVIIPFTTSEFDIFYEVGETYPINNPGTSTRAYSVLNGVFRGDVTLKGRVENNNSYFAEVMSPLDDRWSNWNTDTGRPNIVQVSGEINKPVAITWSGQFVQGTELNGLSTFFAFDQKNMPLEMKSIQRAILTSKVQDEGTVMLLIGEQETAAVYVGEAQIFDNNGNSFLASTTGVLGNVNILRGSFGTINPESAFEWKGAVAFFDANKGAWVRYDVNGLFAISDFKMFKYFRKIGQDVLKFKSGQTSHNAINGGVSFRVLGGADPYHEEFVISSPRMYLNPQNDIISDMELNGVVTSFNITAPTLTVTPTSLTGFTYEQGLGPSAFQTFTYTGSNLNRNGSIVVTAPTNYEVSLDGVAYSTSITINYTGVTATGTVRVRLKAGLTQGSFTGTNVTVAGSGVTATVAVSGTVTQSLTPLVIAIPEALSGFNYDTGDGPSVAQSFTITASGLSPATGNITITPPASYEISVTSGTTGFSSSPLTLPYTANGSLANNTVWVRLEAGLSDGNYNLEEIQVSGGGGSDVVYASGSVGENTQEYYRYDDNVGFGTSQLQACQNASQNTNFVWSNFGPNGVGVGAQMYTIPPRPQNNYEGIPLTTYTYIVVNGVTWEIDPDSGVITGLSNVQC